MAMGLRPPDRFTPAAGAGNASQSWKKWLEQYDNYMLASEKHEKDDKIQVATLLTLLGPDALDVYRSFGLTEAEKNDIKIVKRKFEGYYTPKVNETYERYKFLKRRQAGGEKFEVYLAELKNLISTCQYHPSENDKILRDQIVTGIHSNAVREKLLDQDKLTLDKAIELCRSNEVTTDLLQQMTDLDVNTSNKEVNAVTRARFKQKQPKEPRQTRMIVNCKYCTKEHKAGNCPAYGKACRKCGKLNHFAVCCRSKPIKQADTSTREPVSHSRAHAVDGVTDVVYTVASNEDSWHVVLDVSGRGLRAKVDTGATCNVMTKTVFDVLCKAQPNRLGKSYKRLESYGGTLLTVLGKATFSVEYRQQFHVLEFVVVNEHAPTLIGLPSCRELQLVQNANSVHYVNEAFQDVFEGSGLITCRPHTIKLSDDATPVVHPARRIPFRLTDQFMKTLNEMEKGQIIMKVTEPTEWVNQIVVVRKPSGDLRICLDPGDLNRAIRREHYPMPTVSEIVTKVQGSKYFTTLDAKSGFLQIPLDKDSSYLTTFATPNGRYRFLRLPYGIKSAPEVFSRTIVEIFENLKGVETYVDDILIHAKTEEEHDRRLRAVLEKCREVGLRLNKDKSRFKQTQITFLGHVITENGLKADPSKVRAINDMPIPENVADVRRFLGMVTYLAKFTPHLSELTAPLRDLTKSDSCFCWDVCLTQAFNKIKEEIGQQVKLKIFDITKPVVVTVDASSHGLGAAVLQDGQPIEYASCSLNDTQRRYSQIEKEMMAVKFGLERFHQYVYGQPVTVETDHKPLLGIVRKSLNEISPRLQSMRMKIDRYDYKLIHRPGRELVVADTLSRAPLALKASSSTEHANLVYAETTTPHGRQELQRLTAEDSSLQIVMQHVQGEWPPCKRGCSDQAKPYWHIRNELSTHDGMLFKNEQIIIPYAYRRHVLNSLHAGHLGIVKTIHRAKTTVYWPGYVRDIQSMIEHCSPCQAVRNALPHEPLVPTPLPDYPFQKIGADLFYIEGETYLLTVDYYSKWPSIMKLRNTTTADVVIELKHLFTDFGTPEVIVSDNGPQFASAEFRKFLSAWNIQQTTSSPTFAQSNGQVERTVQTLKNMIRKCNLERSDVHVALLAIRDTPISNKIPAPSILLQGRRLRSTVPLLNSRFPETYDRTAICNEFATRTETMTYYHNRKVGPEREPLHRQDTVRVRINGKWHLGVIEDSVGTRSYRIRLDDHRVFIRNNIDIRPTKEPFVSVLGPRVINEPSVTDTPVPNNAEASDTPTTPVRVQNRDNDSSVRTPSAHNTPPSDTRYVTKSGRQIQQPKRLADYDLN